MKSMKEQTSGVFKSTTLAIYSLIAVVPLMLVLNNSFRTTRQIYAAPLGIPSAEGLGNYAFAWSKANFSQYFFNSVVVTVGALALGVSLALIASYALARIRFPGNGLISALFLAGMLLPAQLGVVPIFHILSMLGLIDNILGLILVYAAQAMPLSVLILTMFFRQLPGELEEAARLDGASRWQILFFVMVPLVMPALATVVVVQAAPIWNDIFYPLILMRSQSSYTLPIGLVSFVGSNMADYGGLYAGIVIVSAPILIIFVFATKYVVSGLTVGMGK
jgi:raffinose/stachyose/melibiose transport system permease protein